MLDMVPVAGTCLSPAPATFTGWTFCEKGVLCQLQFQAVQGAGNVNFIFWSDLCKSWIVCVCIECLTCWTKCCCTDCGLASRSSFCLGYCHMKCTAIVEPNVRLLLHWKIVEASCKMLNMVTVLGWLIWRFFVGVSLCDDGLLCVQFDSLFWLDYGYAFALLMFCAQLWKIYVDVVIFAIAVFECVIVGVQHLGGPFIWKNCASVRHLTSSVFCVCLLYTSPSPRD